METLRNSKHARKTLTYPNASGRRVELRPDPDRMILSARGRDARRHLEGWLASAKLAAKPWSLRVHPHQSSVLVELPSAPGPRRKALAGLHEIVEKQMPRARLVGQLAAPVHVDGFVHGLTRQLIVRFKPHVSAARVTELAGRHQLTRVRGVPYAGNCHVLAIAAPPTHDLIETIGKLAADPDVVYAEPDLVTVAVKDGNDFLLPEQRDLTLIGCPAAWAQMPASASAGSAEITVAVIDLDGVDPDHPDLSGVLRDGRPKQRANHDFVMAAAQQQRDLGGSHGTQCAATAVGGFDNAIGIAGVAGDCRLVAARISDTPTVLEIADAWLWAAGLPTGSTDPGFPAQLVPGADVISCSWSLPGPLPAVLRAAIEHITTFGRGGRGCVMCFSAGNWGDSAPPSAAAEHERTIGVGASVNLDATQPALVDTRAVYSPSGELDLVAPSSTTVGSAPLDPTVSATRVGFGAWTSERAIATPLAADAPAGASTITVADAGGFRVDDRLLVGVPGGADREFSAIRGIDAAARTLTLTPPLAHAHAAGTEVSTGHNDHDRTAGGTSHATALVAGAAALVLSTKPALTWRDVREILRRSATRIDQAQADPAGRWVDRDGDGEREFSPWYGYGRLNVEEAVRMARTYAPTPVAQGTPPIGLPVVDPEPSRRSWPWLALLAALVAIAAGVLYLSRSPGGGPVADRDAGVHSGGGGGTSDAVQVPLPECDLPSRLHQDECTPGGCGSNGMYLSGFIVNGLSLDGCRNHEGVRLVPDSLRGGPGNHICPAGPMMLDLVGGELVGRDRATGAIVCPADAIGDSTFTIEGPEGTHEIRIRSTDTVDAFNVGPRERVRTYSFEAPGGGTPACQPATSWIQDWTTTTPAPSFPPGEPTPAVLVAGELYDPRSAEVEADLPGPNRWFNVACAGGALSKMRLMGLDPTRATSTPGERQATLKMITAKYCGTTSYTENGVGLLWTSLAGKTEPAGPLAQLGPLEAQWTARGAICLSHSRAWRRDQPPPVFLGVPPFFTEQSLIDLVRGTCGIPACPDPPALAPSDDTVYWTTTTVNHISHETGS